MAMHYMGLKAESETIAALAYQAENLPGTTGIDALRKAMLKYAPIISRPTIYNQNRKQTKKPLILQEITFVKSAYPTLIIPLSSDSLVNRAICVVDNLIFDSTQSHVMKCQLEVISWICDSCRKGISDVYEAFRIKHPVKCSPLTHSTKTNW